jgi:putative tricarboxylic transport membrane protein
VFWGFIASMYVGNFMLLILNLPLVFIFVQVLRIPYGYLFPAIVMFCILGVYAASGAIVDVWIMLIMGVLGYVLRKLDFETAPIVLGLILSPLIELAMRQSLSMSNGSYAIFIEKPIAATLLAAALVLLILGLLPLIAGVRDWRTRLAAADGDAERK